MKCPLTCMTTNPRMLYTHWGFIWLIFVASKVGHSSPPFILLIWECMTWLWILPLKSFGSRHFFLSFSRDQNKKTKGMTRLWILLFFFYSGFKYLKVILGTNDEDTKKGSRKRLVWLNSQANKQFKPVLFAFEAIIFLHFCLNY